MSNHEYRSEMKAAHQGARGGCPGAAQPAHGVSRRRFLHGVGAAGMAMGGLALPRATASAEGDAPEGAGAPAGAAPFVSLFNGHDFAGWRFSDEAAHPEKLPEQWTIAEGTIQAVGRDGPILASQWDYEDFEFEFEWRATGDTFDADLYVRSGRLLDADPIRMVKGNEGGRQETDRGEGVYNAISIGGGGRNRAAVPQLQKPLGEWNTWRIRAEGGTLSLWCNGRQAWHCDDYVPLRGYLGFRVMQGPLELRNLRIRELGYASLMDFAQWESAELHRVGGRGTFEDSWRQDGDLWVFQGVGPSLVTKKKDFRNYHIRVEYVFSAPDPTDTNTGIYLRGVHPWQAEIWHHKWGSGGLWGLRHGQPDLGKAVRPILRMDSPPGQWNYIDVLVENDVASVWLNGRMTINRYAMKKVDPRIPDVGSIALQSHGDGKEIRFRNIRVKILE